LYSAFTSEDTEALEVGTVAIERWTFTYGAGRRALASGQTVPNETILVPISSFLLRCRQQRVNEWLQTNVIRYFGIFIVQSRTFKCSIDEAKRSFYRAANAIFGKIGRFASEEVTIHLLKTKCIPVLLYGLEALPMNKSQISSIDFNCH